MTTLITAASLVLADRVVSYPVLLLEDGLIRSIGSLADAPLAAAGAHHDYPGATLAPALLDVHTHGCKGHDVMEATPSALATIGRFLAGHGVGAYLATTISAPQDRILRSLEGLAARIAEAPESGHARPLGIHLEGPFLSHAKRGTHPVRDLVEPSIPLFDAMFEAAEGRVILMTIAPELPGALDLIAHAIARGVRVSIGHSNARTGEARAAIAHGAVSATHTFNAMRALDQRDPGILGTVLTDDTLYAEFICDGMHTDPAIARLFARAKGSERAILVTDAMSATGMPDGMYKLGDLDVRVVGGRATTSEDTLAGSTLTMDRAVRNYASFAGIPLTQALRAATSNPAAMLQMKNSAGTLAAGQRADFVALSADGNILATYLGGRKVEGGLTSQCDGLQLRHLRHSPSAAKRLDEQHARVQPAPQDVNIVALIVQRRCLPGDDLEIGIDTALVADIEQIERLLRAGRGCMLPGRFRLEQAHRGKAVLDLLKSSQGRLAIVRDCLVIRIRGAAQHRAATTGIEQCL